MVPAGPSSSVCVFSYLQSEVEMPSKCKTRRIATHSSASDFTRAFFVRLTSPPPGPKNVPWAGPARAWPCPPSALCRLPCMSSSRLACQGAEDGGTQDGDNPCNPITLPILRPPGGSLEQELGSLLPHDASSVEPFASPWAFAHNLHRQDSVSPFVASCLRAQQCPGSILPLFQPPANPSHY